MTQSLAVFRPALLHPRFWLTWFAMGLWWLAAQLPLRLLVPLGKGVGQILYLLGGDRRRIVEKNIELCFPDLSSDGRRRLVRDNFRNYGVGLFEVAIGWWWSNRRLEGITRVEGFEHLENLHGRGALLMAMHFTSLEIGGQVVNLRMAIDAMYRPHKNPVYEYLQARSRVRRRRDCAVFPRREVRGVLKALKAGRVVWYAPDQDYGPKQSIFAPFFGIPAASVTATAKFARAGNALVLPFVHYRRADNSGYDVVIYPPLEDFPSGDDVADATRVNAIVEHHIRQHPEQYLWAHRRFKTRPAGEPSPYRRGKVS